MASRHVSFMLVDDCDHGIELIMESHVRAGDT